MDKTGILMRISRGLQWGKNHQAKEVYSKVTDNYINHILEQLGKLSHTPPLN